MIKRAVKKVFVTTVEWSYYHRLEAFLILVLLSYPVSYCWDKFVLGLDWFAK